MRPTSPTYPTYPTSNQPPKQLQQFEESTPKRPKTNQTDIPSFSSVHPETATDASDEHQAQSSMDIPLPTAEAGGNLDADVAMPMVTMPGHQISTNPNPVLALEWRTKIFALRVPQHADPFSVEAPATLRASAKPMADLSLVDKRTKAQFAGKLAALRWTHRLTLCNFKLILGPLSDPIASSINLLVDRAADLPDLPQARAQHTLALMLAAGESRRELYAQLHARAASRANLAPHIDWEQLPVHAILVDYLALGPATDEFQALVEEVLDTLPTFSGEVQAQVYADLCASFDPGYRQILSGLDTAESKAQLERLEHFEAAALAYSTKTPIDPVHVAPLFKALPSAGVPWNLSALFALRLLTRLHRVNMLTFEQAQALIDKGAEMLRHFMSLARPDATNHPLIDAAQFLSTHLELQAAFMQLSPQEKVKLLNIYPIERALDFVDDLVQGDSLSVPEKLRLIEDILNQPGVPIVMGTMLRHRLGYLLRQADQL